MAWDEPPPPDTSAPSGGAWSEPPPEYQPSSPSLGSQILSGAGKVLDYPRSALGSPILDRINSAITGKPTTSQWGASGNPRATDILAKDNIPPGESLSDAAPILFAPQGYGNQHSAWNPLHYAAEKGGFFDVTPRGVAGGIADMATDPLSYLSAGVNKAVQAAKAAGTELSPALQRLSILLNPGSNATESMGETAYASGMRPLLNQAEKFGKTGVEDTLYNQGVYGSAGRVARVGDQAAEKLKASRDATMDAAQQAIDSAQPKPNLGMESEKYPDDQVGVQSSLGNVDSPGASKPGAVNVVPTHLNVAVQDPIATAGREAQPDLFGGSVEPHVSAGERPRYTNDHGYSREAEDPETLLTQRLAFSKSPGESAVAPQALPGGTISYPGTHEQIPLDLMDRAERTNGPLGEEIRTPMGSEQLPLQQPVTLSNTASPSAARAYQPLVDHINQLVKDKRITSDKAQSMLDDFSHKLSGEDPTLQQMSQWKTDASNAAGTAYDQTKNPTMAKRMSQIEAGGNRDEIARAANNALPGSGDQINATNKELGNLLTVQGVADKQAMRAGNAPLIAPNAGNHALTTGFLSHNPLTALGHLLGSSTLKALNNRAVQNSVGYAARKLGTNAVTAPVIDAATFNALKNMANPQPVAGVGK